MRFVALGRWQEEEGALGTSIRITLWFCLFGLSVVPHT